MKIFKLLFMFFIVCQTISCLNAPRDNRYDPKNPDKSVVRGYAYEPDSLAVEGAVVALVRNDTIVMADTSDPSGYFILEGIDPAIYTITADAKHYGQLVVEAESLWAGIEVTDLNMIFTTFDFEDDYENADETYGFRVVSGNWQIRHDEQDPDMRSTPHFYAAVPDSQDQIALTLFRSLVKDFDFQIKIKVPALPDTMWRAGMIIGFQDIRNFYALEITPRAINLKHIADSVSTTVRTDSLRLSTNAWHSIENTSLNGLMTFYNSGEYLFLIVDDSLAEAGIGLWATNPQDGSATIGAFDDVTIHRRYEIPSRFKFIFPLGKANAPFRSLPRRDRSHGSDPRNCFKNAP